MSRLKWENLSVEAGKFYERLEEEPGNRSRNPHEKRLSSRSWILHQIGNRQWAIGNAFISRRSVAVVSLPGQSNLSDGSHQFRHHCRRESIRRMEPGHAS